MSGHSKWSTIKHKKAATDAKRGRLFTRLIREITVSARLGGRDQSANPRLRSAIQEAKGSNVPGDTIERAIKKGTGELGGDIVEEVFYEGYAPGGVAVLVEAFTDNRNRTASEVRHLFSRHGGNLGEAGCVHWMFSKRGYFAFNLKSMSEEDFMEIAVEVEAEDFSNDASHYEMFTSMESYASVVDDLVKRGIDLEIKQLSMVPTSYVEVEEEGLPKVLRLLEALEDLDDVQHVWSNFDADDEVLARASENI
jgi:YebC/PmpR family DNA-binding regulatory protein